MASQTEICNLALSHLGVAKPIANLESEKTAEAAACRTFYDITRRRMFRDFPWPFARRVVALGLVEETPNDDWSYSYRYPSGVIKIRKIFSGIRNDTAKSKTKYILASDSDGNLIWTDLNPASALTISDITNPQFYPDDFVMAFSFLLAFYIGPRVMDGDPANLRRDALAAYNQEISRASSNAHNEEAPDLVPDSEFIKIRDGSDELLDCDSFRTNF